ncbi:MAG: GAD-like domain-containing protein [Cystobacter sp.]
MRDEYFQVFVDEIGEATSRMTVPESSIKKFKGVLPEQFLTYWKEEGWCEYGNGLFWTVNPEEYGGLVDLWLAGTPYEKVDTFHVVARSPFGKLYAWGERNNRTLTISCPNNALVAIDAELRTPEEDPDMAAQVFFSSKNKRSFDFKDSTGKGLFERALKKLGPLRPDEIYGFEPALVAGGMNRLENLSKLNLFAHLTLLRQLAGPTIPFAGVQVR